MAYILHVNEQFMIVGQNCQQVFHASLLGVYTFSVLLMK